MLLNGVLPALESVDLTATVLTNQGFTALLNGLQKTRLRVLYFPSYNGLGGE